MIRYNGLAQDSTDGNALPGASIAVKEYLTGLAAPLFADDGVTPLANPVTADSGGLYHFKIDAGIYSLAISKGTYLEIEDLVTVIDDPSIVYMVNDDSVAMVDGDLVYVSGDGLVKKSVSTSSSAESAVFAICVETLLDSTDTGRFRTFGQVNRSGTSGLLGYLGQASEITAVVPEYESGDRFAVILGRQIRAGTFLFNPPGGGGVLELAPLAPDPSILSFHLTRSMIQALPGAATTNTEILMGHIPAGMVVQSTLMVVNEPFTWPMGYGDGSATRFSGHTTGHSSDIWPDKTVTEIGGGLTVPRAGLGYDDIDAYTTAAAPGLVTGVQWSQMLTGDITFIMTLIAGP